MLNNLRHRADGPTASDPRLWWTACDILFGPFGSKRDMAFHKPALKRCEKCYV